MNISLTASDTEAKIYFNGVLHLAVNSPITALQSWIDTTKWFRTWYKIEIHFENGHTVLLEYDKKSIWKQMLSIFDEAFKIPNANWSMATTIK